MQSIVFVGRLAADPQITEDAAKGVFRLLENRGRKSDGEPRLVGVNCVSWRRGVNQKVLPQVTRGCEVVAIGSFVDTEYIARDGTPRAAKELSVARLTVLDWSPKPRPADLADAIA